MTPSLTHSLEQARKGATLSHKSAVHKQGLKEGRSRDSKPPVRIRQKERGAEKPNATFDYHSEHTPHTLSDYKSTLIGVSICASKSALI